MSLSLFDVRVHIIALIHIAPFSFSLFLCDISPFRRCVALSIVWKKKVASSYGKRKRWLTDWLTDWLTTINTKRSFEKWINGQYLSLSFSICQCIKPKGRFVFFLLLSHQNDNDDCFTYSYVPLLSNHFLKKRRKMGGEEKKKKKHKHSVPFFSSSSSFSFRCRYKEQTYVHAWWKKRLLTEEKKTKTTRKKKRGMSWALGECSFFVVKLYFSSLFTIHIFFLLRSLMVKCLLRQVVRWSSSLRWILSSLAKPYNCSCSHTYIFRRERYSCFSNNIHECKQNNTFMYSEEKKRKLIATKKIFSVSISFVKERKKRNKVSV